MEINVQLKQLLEEKLEHLRAFEAFTMQMLDCRTEQLEELIEQREQIIGTVDLLDAQAESLCGQHPDEARIRRLMRGEQLGDASSVEAEICDAVRQIRTVLSLLQESDCQAAIRLRVEQEQILKQIKNANRGVGAQASRFYNSAFGASAEHGSSIGNA